jgi:ribosomal protein S18 acetylase RimI-like enzyme
MALLVEEQALEQSQLGLRRMDPTRDLGNIADLITTAFADELDERGRAALREMRWMARLTPLVWWWAQVDPSFRDAFNGFVWEELDAERQGRRPVRRTVGNVSLSRAPGDRSRWIICNVVVADQFQGRGIGRKMVQAAVEEARHMGAAGVVLQVHQDNVKALHLYTGMGFRQASGEVDLFLEAVRPVAVLDAPGYRIRPWKPADGGAAHTLARQAVPQTQQWLRPVRADAYRLDWLTRLARWITNLSHGRRVYHLTAFQGGRMVALMSVTVAFRHGTHNLALLIHPDHKGHVEGAMLSRGIHMLMAAPLASVRATVDQAAEDTLELLRDYSFREQRRLLTLCQDFGQGTDDGE